MHFRTKNTFYLRISAEKVVPLCLYIDEKHVEWMSELVVDNDVTRFNSEDEGPLLLDGLRGKKSDVTIRKRETYQFAYFFRKSQPHSVLFKTRTFIEEKVQNIPQEKDKLLASSTEFNHGEIDEEEEKPKLKMQVSYKGLTVTEESLCIIIEPRAGEPFDNAGNLRQRTLEETIGQRQGSSTLPLQREKTPLFLPDLDPDPERDSFSPFPIRRRSPPEVEEEREYGSLQAFGETLNSMRDGVAGDIDDDDDDEGQVFLGDADERKGPV